MQAPRVLLLAAFALWLSSASRAEQIQRIDAEATGQAVAVDGSGIIAYVADADRNFVTAVERTGHTTRFAVGPNPRWIASNGDVYTSNAGDGSVTLIAGDSRLPSPCVDGMESPGNGTYSGTLYSTTGPPLAASPWDPSKVSRMPAGNATLTFSDEANGTFTSTVGGVTQSKPITRQVYGNSTTRCQ